jgi:DNA-binding CsgD family transcriptional regulator
MIVTQNRKKEQELARLKLKCAESAFRSVIVRGTNCSPFESQIIADKAREMFAVGEWSDGRVLEDGQMIFHAAAADEPPGKPLAENRLVRLILSHVQRDEDLEVWREHGAAAKRRQQIVRMTVEAKEQGGLLTQEELGLILDCDPRTIRADVAELKKQGVIAPTRGTVLDIGPGVTHKQRAVELWLEGKEALEVARHLHHSLKSVERYIQTFCRVVYAQRKLRDILKTALVVGISVPGAHVYWDLHCDLCEDNQDYRARLDEVLGIGEKHWIAADGKKSPSPTARPKNGGSRP